MKIQKEIDMRDLRRNLTEIINEASFGKQRIILNRRGKRLVALIPIEDLEALEKQEEIGLTDLCEK